MALKSALPETMRALTIPSYTTPANYNISQLPVPSISNPAQVLIKVHAACINPVDVKKAAGMMKYFETVTFPMVIGLDFSGTVVQVGDDVTDFKAGDEIYGSQKVKDMGAVCEYVVASTENRGALCQKPPSLSHIQAASLPVVGFTALDCFDAAEASIPGGLKGKTVFIPAGLSGTGSIALQLAKNVFGAAKVITTVSTAKVARVPELLGENTVDQIIDYTKADVMKEIQKGSVDFLYDTMGECMAFLSLMKQKGVIRSIASIPSGSQMASQMPDIPSFIVYTLNLVSSFYKWRAGRWSVDYAFFAPNPEKSHLERLSRWAEEGKIRTVVGRTVKLSDLQSVREGCQEVNSGKGGIGKFVIEID
ncbi:hypothetical protein MMC24_001098 [Lignoscripta atroalba]|nr:hypothetical protein [Lignoscripta atroalba]